MSDGEFIDLRDQLDAYVQAEDYCYIAITLLSGDKYVITSKYDVLILARVVFIFQSSVTESCFLFDSICNIDVVRKREA